MLLRTGGPAEEILWRKRYMAESRTASEEAAVARFTSPKEVIDFCREQGIKMVDLKLIDLPGTWQHLSIPLTELDEGTFGKGVGFDGSSIRGFQHIEESDMLIVPDATSAFI